MTSDGFDFSPGAQVPITGSAGQTAATHALASAAYRDSPVATILDANSEWYKSEVTKGRFSLFEPNLGEAFARAVQVRTLGGGRNALIQSFGMEPRTVAEHCLAANRIRRERDLRLTIITVVCGVLFLPGLLFWMAVFQLRRTLAGAQNKSAGLGGILLLLAICGLALIVLIKLPLAGFWPNYLRAMLVVPVIGWFLARRVAESTAKDLRSRWDGLLSGGGIAAKVPDAVGRDELRDALNKLTAEQHANSAFYAGHKGILGMGTRWGSWSMAEEMVSKTPGKEINQFRSWDVARAIHDRLKLLERGPLNSGGFTPPQVKHWVISSVGAGAGSVSRPEGDVVESFQVKSHEIQRICNHQQFGKGDRHYLGVQFVLWDGQLVITMMITVTVLHETLRIEVTGHALGPVHGLFMAKSSPKTVTVAKTVRFWETRTRNLPLIEAPEVVRLAVRAPLTWYPPLLDFLGGKLVLPEPFGLRHVWAEKPWGSRFMADDAMRAATPVLRAAHAAAMKILDDNGVDIARFSSRSMAVSGAIQDPSLSKADLYEI
ncbi:hypothetical protein ACFVIM_27355 [Streptomyces sp. NPDC057638]|uniref:hypothetical protein n=1 Tax=Streptomyces sp. NPDC057638 TaxID=3346190 RepID=UPI0036772FD2